MSHTNPSCSHTHTHNCEKTRQVKVFSSLLLGLSVCSAQWELSVRGRTLHISHTFSISETDMPTHSQEKSQDLLNARILLAPWVAPPWPDRQEHQLDSMPHRSLRKVQQAGEGRISSLGSQAKGALPLPEQAPKHWAPMPVWLDPCCFKFLFCKKQTNRSGGVTSRGSQWKPNERWPHVLVSGKLEHLPVMPRDREGEGSVSGRGIYFPALHQWPLHVPTLRSPESRACP